MSYSGFTPSFPRYLAAKKTVDDRALNRTVWQVLATRLDAAKVQSPLRVLDIGAGIGTMFERSIDWGLLPHAHYTALDALPENIAAARPRLVRWAEENGFHIRTSAGGKLHFTAPQLDVTLDLITTDLFDFIQQQHRSKGWDLLIAHAFLDLMDIPTTLPHLFTLLRPGGLFYFTINFDGATLFEPVIDPVLDQHIEALYHRTMDARLIDGNVSGDSQAGRHLFKHLPAAGATILAAGASDWVVHPTASAYPGDEAYFLHFIIHTIDQALGGHPDLDMDCFAAWIADRHAQIERRELIYIAHQLDFAGYYPGPLASYP